MFLFNPNKFLIYLPTAVSKSGAVAEQAENHTFTTIAVEICGAFDPLSMQFIRELSCRLKLVANEPQSLLIPAEIIGGHTMGAMLLPY